MTDPSPNTPTSGYVIRRIGESPNITRHPQSEIVALDASAMGEEVVSVSLVHRLLAE